MHSSPVLEATGLTVARGKRVLLENLDVSLRRGEVVVILGPNGVGKSTLLSVLAGLLPHPRGSLRVHGRVAAALQAPALAHRSVQANLQLAMSWWGVPREQRAQRARDALALLRIEHLAERLAEHPARARGEQRARDALALLRIEHLSERLADTLSGGEARRVHLARALSLHSDVL